MREDESGLSVERDPARDLLGLSGRRRLLRRSGLGFDRLGLDALQDGSRPPASAGPDRQSYGGDHERHCRPGGGPGKRTRRAARTESRLAALSAEGGGDVAALAALQQHDDDDEEANQDVNRDD
jgi:hypothetical protein